MKTVDYIIVGQGIAGTFLSWYLQQQGASILVIENNQFNSASKIASGIINPITGRRVVTTWMIEEIMPFAQKAYEQLGVALQTAIIQPTPLLSFPGNEQMQQAYQEKINQKNQYVKAKPHHLQFHHQINYTFDFVQIEALIVNILPMLTIWQNQLHEKNCLLKASFCLNELQFSEQEVVYKNYRAKKIIFCNGIEAFKTPYWEKLPFVLNKGEAIIANIPDMNRNYVYKFGSTTLVPWYNGLWWVGSSYDNQFTTPLPTKEFLNQKTSELKNLLKVPFSIQQHVAAIRPACIERRPFVGLHPTYPAIGILNGMGTKGCSLAPYFANELAKHLTEENYFFSPEADVHRFKKLLTS